MAIRIRTMTPDDRGEVSALIQLSLNYWYQTHGLHAVFSGNPHAADVFFEVYDALEPGCGILAEDERTGLVAGSCFYHPRPHHYGLGIMNTHPNYFGSGVAGVLLRHIVELARSEGKPVRLTSSALNLTSFSLYTRAGFVPRCAFQDMLLKVPPGGLDVARPDEARVRQARLDDVAAMAGLEMEVSGITREMDYRFCIGNAQGFWHASVYENDQGGVDGFLISCGHPCLNMLGPGVARGEREAAALIWRELDVYRGRAPTLLIPVERAGLVRALYQAGARNCEMHFCQVLGEYQPFAGVSMPTFLPETG
jgi:GNAT superfamily N-acetyltransferase